MNWFKRLSKERRANPNSHCDECHNHKRCCTHNDSPASASMLASLCDNKIELVDPEDFFQDPDHVRRYKEEEHFLKLMSEWEIIDHPHSHANFFSADFEEELIHLRTQPLPVNESDERKGMQDSKSEMSHDQLAVTVVCDRQRRHRFSEMFFGERIETGILPPKVYSDCKVSLMRKSKTDVFKAAGSSIQKDYRVDRELFKSEALSQSIMGAIGQCPDVENKSESKDNSCDQSSCDHYDIKQFFRLDDNGNILLNINHIKEVKGCEMRHSKKFCANYVSGKCVDEGYARRRKGLVILKRILRIFWNLLTGHPRNKINPIGGPGDSVRCYTLQLASDHTSTFAQNIENFISCTKESREAAPQVVMRNMRQFMNGMKNYLVKHGEGKFHQEVESARARLKSDEFLNLDAILETVMHQLVVLPLREHLYGMFVDYYTRSEDIQLLAQNVKYACGRNAADFGIRPAVAPPTSSALHQISNLLLRLQEAELPLEKLDLFLCIISSIFDATGCPRGQQLGADDFLPILVFVVAKCGFVGAEIEAEFMWGLLQPALLNGEAGYYLTALCSAVHVLKSFMASDNEGTGSLDWRSSSLPACSSVLRVIIPDECNGSLQTRTLPVRPHTTTREVCRIIAHKARITNPQDYALFKLVDGEETLLTDVECPQDIRLAAKGKHCMLAYKRIDAKIAWPTAAQPSYA